MNLVDADILYDKFVKLEDQALGEVNKYVHDEGMVDSFKRWSTILNERSAYKHDIIDMPRVDAEPVRHAKWIEHEWAEESEGLLIPNYECSECHTWERNESDYCPKCGARMDETQKSPCDDCQEFDCYGCEYGEKTND